MNLYENVHTRLFMFNSFNLFHTLREHAALCFVFQVMDFWNHTDFQLSAHASRDIAIITGADDIITSVEESQVTLSNIRGSRYVTPIKV